MNQKNEIYSIGELIYIPASTILLKCMIGDTEEYLENDLTGLWKIHTLKEPTTGVIIKSGKNYNSYVVLIKNDYWYVESKYIYSLKNKKGD